MPKIPDFSELSKKFDLQGIVDGFKTVISGTATKPPAKGEIESKFLELTLLLQNLETDFSDQLKAIGVIKTKLLSLGKDVYALQNANAAPTDEPVKPAVKKPRKTKDV